MASAKSGTTLNLRQNGAHAVRITHKNTAHKKNGSKKRKLDSTTA